MYYYLPTKVYSETDCIANHKKELASLGKKALLVTGKHSARKNGALDDVVAALEEQKIAWCLFDRIEENPSVETVCACAEEMAAESIDFVIGIGGGSPMDAAKAIAFLLNHPGCRKEILYNREIDDAALPVVAIPTTCGTGSEVTGVSVLTRHDLSTKQSIPHKIFPVYALIDGKYLVSAPKKILSDTAIDALGHMWESYLNTKATDFSRMFVREGLRIWSRCLPVLKGETVPGMAEYQDLMTASCLAGMSIAHTGTTVPHALSYPVTYHLHEKHGKAVGRFLSGYIRFAAESDKQELLSLSGFSSVEEFESLFVTLCSPEKLPEELSERMIEDLLKKTDRLALVPYEVTREILTQIVKGVDR